MAAARVSTEVKDLSQFLALCDLDSHELRFNLAGVRKIEHLEDIDDEDLKDIGLSKIEIKRFQRLKKEFLEKKVAETAREASTSSTLLKYGQVVFNRQPTSLPPWQDKNKGWIPNATTPRAMFMNSVLPDYYKSMSRFCSSREFVKKFHSEGRRRYELNCTVTCLDTKLPKILNPQNPAAAGKYLSEGYTLVPSDRIVINNNLREIDCLQSKVEKALETLRKDFNDHFTKDGKKLIGGHQCSNDFDGKVIGELIKIKEKVVGAGEKLKNKLELCHDMFKGININKNKRRAQKENRRKIKRRKEKRVLQNVEKIRSAISKTTTPSAIDDNDLNLEAVASLSSKQMKHLQLLFQEGMLTEKAIHVIQGYHPNFPSNQVSNTDECVVEESDSGESSGESGSESSGENSEVE